MKHLISILIIVFGIAGTIAAQDTQYYCKDGYVHFFSSAPMEDIEAKNNEAVVVFNATKNEINAKIPIKSFQFAKKLMQEHFNENYLESDKYPYGSLTGKIVENIDFTKDGVHKVTVRGVLDIHGVKQNRDIPCTITVQGDQIKVYSEFDVKLVDHKIKIPKVVILNIAEVIKVDMLFNLNKK